MGYHSEQLTEDSRSKRQQILNAAYEVFSRKGYNRATVDEIIALADTGKGTVYNYFVNKEQLFYTLIQERNAPVEMALEQIADSERPTIDKLETMVRLFLQFYIQNADLWRVLMHEIRGFELGHSVLTVETREKYHGVYRRIIEKLEKVLSEGISQGVLRDYDVDKGAYGLFAVIMTMVYQKMVDDDSIEAVAQNITEIFLYGMAQK